METEERTGIGIRGRLGGFAVVGVVAFMGMAGVLAERVYSDRLALDARSRSAALLESFSVPCAIAVAKDNLEQLDTYLAGVASAGTGRLHVVHVAMLGEDGHVVAQAFSPGIEAHWEEGILGQGARRYPLSARAERPLWALLDLETSPVLQIAMPAVSGLRWGTLVAHFDLRHHHRLLAQARTALIVVTFGLMLLVLMALFVGLWQIVVRPVRLLASAAHRVRKGDLTTRVLLKSRDELGALARTFNSMARELQENTENLEQKVEDRTRELGARTRELEEVNGQLNEAVERLDRLARTDPLTGLYNRGHFMEALDSELLRSQRSGQPFSVILSDIDHFKTYNDNHGHASGDTVLCGVAHSLVQGIRETDTVARYGGEEFVILLIDTPLVEALSVAEGLRERVESTTVADENGETLHKVTMSFGVAEYPKSHHDSAGLLRGADVALYAAKAEGRNCVVAAQEA